MPNIILDSVRGPQPVPIDDMFLKDRKIFLVGEVNDASCNDLIKQLLYMEAEDNTQPITLFINSPGGQVGSGLAVYDTIRLMKSPVTAVVTGIAASMGSIIMLACDEDKRLMLPSSKVMIHDCSWGHREMGGMKPFEIEQELRQLEQVNERLISIIAERTGNSVEDVSNVTMCDSYFNAEEAIEFGLASKVIDSDCLGELMKRNAA